ncbi:MAG: hypothetical protein DRH57_09375 [Candidatus Cloacimonadota bacterium]|nr:MAG: hypothetical protein DRH57_09375 [Candidatus Cloacimonadota bacterium]
MKTSIDKFLYNRDAGADELAAQEIEIIQKMLTNGYTKKQITNFLNQAYSQFPVMAPIIKIKLYLQKNEINLNNLNNIRKILADKSYIQNSKKIFTNIISILTFSNSSSVRAIFLHYKKLIQKIICCHSLPLGEGNALHKFLLDNNMCSQIIEDSETSLYMEKVNSIIIGADMVTEDYVVNKIGSLQLALLARYYDKPVYVIASKSKFINKHLVNFSNWNSYFEKVDRSLITEIIN